MSVDLSAFDLWCIVDNGNFSADHAYKPVAYLDYGPRETGQLLFITDEGAPYALPVTRTRVIKGHELWSRPLRRSEGDVAFFAPGEIRSYWDTEEEGGDET